MCQMSRNIYSEWVLHSKYITSSISSGLFSLWSLWSIINIGRWILSSWSQWNSLSRWSSTVNVLQFVIRSTRSSRYITKKEKRMACIHTYIRSDVVMAWRKELTACVEHRKSDQSGVLSFHAIYIHTLVKTNEGLLISQHRFFFFFETGYSQ